MFLFASAILIASLRSRVGSVLMSSTVVHKNSQSIRWSEKERAG